jgi:hypothetical protein
LGFWCAAGEKILACPMTTPRSLAIFSQSLD